MARNEDLQMTFSVGHHTMLIVNVLFKTLIFQRIGKINYQSFVSDAGRKIPTLRSTDNAGNSGNSVNLISDIIRLPWGWDFSASETADRFYLSDDSVTILSGLL